MSDLHDVVTTEDLVARAADTRHHRQLHLDRLIPPRVDGSHVHQANAAAPWSIVARCHYAGRPGWPERMHGEQRCQTTVGSALRAPSPSHLRMRAPAVRRGAASTAQLAHRWDRHQLTIGLGQTYGTQLWVTLDVLVQHPIAGSEDLDARRARAGLQPARFALLVGHRPSAGGGLVREDTALRRCRVTRDDHAVQAMTCRHEAVSGRGP
jgi:hypothetical protein